jgi:hypothetical protein
LLRPQVHRIGQHECDQRFVPAVETGLRMLQVWQESVSDPENASPKVFGELWCCGAPVILSILFTEIGQHQVPNKERTSSDIAVYDLIEDEKSFIEATGAAVLARLIDELSDKVCDETRRVGLAVADYVEWSEADFELLRGALFQLADISLRNDEIRKLNARVSRELMIVQGETDETEDSRVEPSDPDVREDAHVESSGDPSEDGPVDPSGFRWKGKEFSDLTPTAFRLLMFHWDEGKWRARYFNKHAFGREVFIDAEVTVDRSRVDSHQTKINHAFVDSEMLLRMKVEKDRTFVYKITQGELKELQKRKRKRRNN